MDVSRSPSWSASSRARVAPLDRLGQLMGEHVQLRAVAVGHREFPAGLRGLEHLDRSGRRLPRLGSATAPPRHPGDPPMALADRTRLAQPLPLEQSRPARLQRLPPTCRPDTPQPRTARSSCARSAAVKRSVCGRIARKWATASRWAPCAAAPVAATTPYRSNAVDVTGVPRMVHQPGRIRAVERSQQRQGPAMKRGAPWSVTANPRRLAAAVRGDRTRRRRTP